MKTEGERHTGRQTEKKTKNRVNQTNSSLDKQAYKAFDVDDVLTHTHSRTHTHTPQPTPPPSSFYPPPPPPPRPPHTQQLQQRKTTQHTLRGPLEANRWVIARGSFTLNRRIPLLSFLPGRRYCFTSRPPICPSSRPWTT